LRVSLGAPLSRSGERVAINSTLIFLYRAMPLTLGAQTLFHHRRVYFDIFVYTHPREWVSSEANPGDSASALIDDWRALLSLIYMCISVSLRVSIKTARDFVVLINEYMCARAKD
jgi:hypothetical protein